MKITGTNLSMIRGDTESITVSCTNPDNTFAPLITGDKVYFTVKKSIHDTEKVLQKLITSFDEGKAIVSILPTDTKSIKFGDYIYDIQITKANGTVTTIVPPSTFTLLGEVTYE